jgi:hypothetical protein
MDPGREGEEWIESASTPIVKVDIDASIVGENEVAYRISPLDIVPVLLKGFEEPGILFLNERVAVFVRPELVLVVWV